MKRLLLPAERLLDVLNDPAQRERTVLFLLGAYAALWTLYGVFAKASQDIHFDMAELIAWSREPALGYSKHPPLAAWLVRAWFAIFPTADWAYYLLAITVATAALLLSWRLFARYLEADKRVVALALLTLIPFYNFHALKFNPNTVLLPLWAATTLFFLRSYEARRPLDATLAGFAAGLCMLGKYWSIVLLLGLGLAALIDSRRSAYFRSSAPWITIAVGAVTLAPHALWLFENDFLPFAYALDVHGKEPLAAVFKSVAGYLSGAMGYAALPVFLVLIGARPDRLAVVDIAAPKESSRRLAAAAFWLPLLLPVALSPLIGISINSLWTMSAWTLLPVLLLSSPHVRMTRAAASRIVLLAVAVPFVFVASSTFIAAQIQRAGVSPIAAHGSLLAKRVVHEWRQFTGRPLAFVGGNPELAYAVGFYVPDQPRILIEQDPLAARPDVQTLARAGVVFVCPQTDRSCEAKAKEGAKRVELEIVRSYWGIDGAPAHYTIVIVPPQTP